MYELPSKHFSYCNGKLYCEDVELQSLAEEFGTPLYVYSEATLCEAALAYEVALKDTPHKLHYAVKANSNLTLLKILQKRGWGFDIVSIGELARVLQIGADPKRIVFSGVGKMDSGSWNRVSINGGIVVSCVSGGRRESGQSTLILNGLRTRAFVKSPRTPRMHSVEVACGQFM